MRLTQDAYADWARLELASGRSLVTKVGGLDLFPPGAAIPPIDYVDSLAEVGIEHEVLDAAAVAARWPQFDLASDVMALYQRDAAIVPAALGTRTMQEQATTLGADLRPRSPVTGVHDLGERGLEVETATGTIRCRGLVVCADAWVNDVVGHLGVRVPVEVTLEQVTYFQPGEPARFAPERMPLWIWMDDPSYYGFPSYGEATVKAAQDCGGPVIDPDGRTSERDPAMEQRLAAFVGDLLPGSRRAGAFVALPVHADSRPRLRDRAGAGARVRRGGSRRRSRFQVRPDVRPAARRPGRRRRHRHRPHRLPVGPPGPDRSRLRRPLVGVTCHDSASWSIPSSRATVSATQPRSCSRVMVR